MAIELAIAAFHIFQVEVDRVLRVGKNHKGRQGKGEPRMNTHTYDIFSGRFGRDVIWIESIKELAVAVEKMKAYANHSPGPYFVFCVHSNEVIASIDTSIQSDIENRQSA
jgi:hypothetical protein